MPATTKIPFNKMKSMFFIGLMFLFSIMMLYLFRPFFYPLFWAAVIAIMFHPLYKWIYKYIKMETPSLIITLLSVILAILLPLVIITLLLISESVKLYQTISAEDVRYVISRIEMFTGSSFISSFFNQPKDEWFNSIKQAFQGKEAFEGVSNISSNIKNITSNAAYFIFMFFIMFYALYFFLKDGKRMLTRLMHLSPLGDTYERMLYERFTSTTRATLKSTFIVGGIQGALGGLLFAIVGIPGAFVWGVVMATLSVIPAVGAFIIWAPAGIILLVTGQVWQGVTVLVVGGLVISTIDNFLRPPLVGKDIQMHPLIVLLSTLGGIFVLGVSGFVIGPIIAALFLSIMTIYDHYYQNELIKNK